MAWTIDAGFKSGVLSRFILTTEDKEIADVGRSAGIEVPFTRPVELAGDKIPPLFVLQHAVSWLKENEGYFPDYVVLLEPTSPGRRPFHIREALDLLIDTGADSVVSVSEVPSHYNPHWQFRIGNKGMLEPFNGSIIKRVIRARQELPKTYFRNGAIYAFKPEFLFAEEPSLYGDDVRAYLMGAKYSTDIDTPEDWGFAERQFKKILDEK